MQFPKLSPLTANQKRFLWVLFLTIPAVALYYGSARLGFLYPHIVYIILACVLAVVYVVYNHGFVTKGRTAEDLSPDIPLAEREKMIADGKARAEKSAWMLYVLLPILFTLIIDMIVLFFVPSLSSLL